ncbi:mucin-2 [Carassius carassius]|uniref:mucin-2 n=1 Tax=Carassius carassius TaxID=217509 RepID=UPI00286869DE|nr:mucin-2 [Carassius carassius]
MLTNENGPKRHIYSWKPHSVGGTQPCFGHPGRCINSKAWHLSSRPQRWRNTAPSYYFCFVKQAVLWNRGQHHTVIKREKCPPPLCSRFHAHMEAWPDHFRNPHFLNMLPRPGPNHLGQKQRQQSAPQPQRCPDVRRNQNVDHSNRSHFSVVLPHVPGCPNPSRASPEPPSSPSLTLKFVDHPQKSQTSNPHLQLKDEEEDACSAPQNLNQGHHETGEEETMTPTTLSTPTTPSIAATPTTPGTQSTPSSPVTPGTPSSSVTPNSLSDFSGPSSSQFSRSTDLNSSFSDALSVNFSVDHCEDNNTDDEDNHASDLEQNNYYQEGCSTSLPELHCSSAGSYSQASSRMDALQAHLSRSLTSCKQETPSTCLPDTPIYTSKTPQSQQTPANQQSTYETVHRHPGSSQSGLSIQSQKCSNVECSTADSRSEWNLWPVLPPIMPQQDELQDESLLGGTPDSLSNRSQSDIFAELDDLAPRSSSCVSPDHPAGSQTDRSSPTTDLSPGLAALTVGCDSGDLGSLSRVQLLLLERRGSESPGSIPSLEWCQTPDGEEYEPGLRVWSSGISQCYQSTVPDNRKPLSGRNSSQDSLAAFKGRRKCPGLISVGSVSRTSSCCSLSPRVSESSSRNPEKTTCDDQGCESPDENVPLYLSPLSPSALLTESPTNGGTILVSQRGTSDHAEKHRNRSDRLQEKRKRKKERKKTEERKNKALQIYSKLQDGKDPTEPTHQSPCSKFEDFDFLAKYCILSQDKLSMYKRAFEAADSDGDGYLSCLQVLLALKEIIPPELLTEEEEIYVYRILELVDFRVTKGLTDLRLFAVVASLAQKIATLDDFMRSLISKMDFKSLEMKLYKAKQLFLFLLEAQTGGALVPEGCIGAEQLLVELKAGGIRPEHEASVRRELRSLRSLDLLDFLAHLPLFILIHNSVIANPFDDTSNL